MDKILVVFTGGTIGSKVATNDVIDVDESINYSLINEYNKRANTDVIFDTIQPLNILSENLQPLHWEILTKSLAEQNLNDYSGIIITHGTDTLPYTTAVISYVLCDIDIPAVFVASNYCVEDPKSNGIENFIAAVQFITGVKLPGVFAIYKNNKDKMIVYLGTRLLEADHSEGQYSSYRGVDFGEMTSDGKLIHNDDAKNVPLSCFEKKNKMPAISIMTFGDHILCINPYPGLNYSMFTFDKARPTAVLHKLFHSSTACVEPGEYSLIQFAQSCKRANVDLYLYDCRHYFDYGVYSTSNELMQEGVYPLMNISYEAALSKLYVAYSQSAIPPAEYMKRNIFWEFV